MWELGRIADIERVRAAMPDYVDEELAFWGSRPSDGPGPHLVDPA